MVGRMRRLWILALLALADCGGDGSGGSLELTRSAGRVVLDSRPSFGVLSVRIAGGDAEATVLWPETVTFDSPATLFVQSVTSELELAGDVHETQASDHRSRHGASACYHEDGLAVAWTDDYEYHNAPTGITYDLADVGATLDWPAEDTVLVTDEHPLLSQLGSSVACTERGSLVLAWTNACRGVERQTSTRFFFPEHCDDLVAPANYFRMYAADGTPATESVRIDDEPFSSIGAPPLVAPLPGGRFFVLTGNWVQTRASDGELIEKAEIGRIWSTVTSVSCGDRYCVAAINGYVVFVDSTNLESRRIVLEEENGTPGPNLVTYPKMASVACDDSDTCVVTWVRELWTYLDEDTVDVTSLGLFAQAFDSGGTRSGPKLQLVDPVDELGRGAQIASVGNKEFLVARVPDREIEITKLRLD